MAAIVLATDVTWNLDSPESGPRRQEVVAACRMLERSRHESVALRNAIHKNTHTLRMILQHCVASPRPEHSLGHDRASNATGSQNKGMLGDVALNTPQKAVDAVNDSLIATSGLASASTAPFILATPTNADWLQIDVSPEANEDAWGKLWSDVFDAGLGLGMPEWDSALDGMDFTDMSGGI